jgi:hypothetical protein
MIEVLKQMQKALREYHYYTIDAGLPNQSMLNKGYAAYQAGKKAIAELEGQEPVATVTSETGNPDITMSWWHEPALTVGTKLYTHPPQRTWEGLTDDEHCDIWYKESLDWMEYGKAIEAKLKQKNGFAEENT